MKVEKLNKDGLQNTFRITITEDLIIESRNKILTDYAKTYRKPGFRPGKVPFAVIEKEFSASARKQAFEDHLETATQQIIKENNLTPAGTPELKTVSGEKDKNFVFEYSVEEMPVIDLKDVSEISLERLVSEIPEEKIKEACDSFYERYAPYKEVEKRAAKATDTVTLKITMTCEGNPVDQIKDRTIYIKPKNTNLVYTKVAEAVVGMKKGESKTVEQDLPATFALKSVAGKVANIAFTIEKIEEQDLSKIDDEFYKKHDCKDKEELVSKIKGQLQEEMNKSVRLHMKRFLFDKLNEFYAFDLPKTIVNQELKNIEKQVKEGEEESLTPEELKQLAERRVRLGLVIGQYAKEHKISPSETIIFEKMRPYLMYMEGNPEENIKKIVQNKEFMSIMRAEALEEAIVDFLLEKITLKDKKVDYTKFTQLLQEVLPE